MYQLYSRRFVIWYCSSYFVFENRNCNTLKPSSRKTMLIKRKTNVEILMLIQLVVYIFINNFIKNCCSSSYLKFLIANWISSSVIGKYFLFCLANYWGLIHLCHIQKIFCILSRVFVVIAFASTWVHPRFVWGFSCSSF